MSEVDFPLPVLRLLQVSLDRSGKGDVAGKEGGASQTELVEQFPMHVVTAWLGNSPDIARKHYLQLTDEHFERAVETVAKSATAHSRKELRRIAGSAKPQT